MDYLAKLKAAAEAAVKKMQDLLELAGNEDRDLTAEEQTAFDAADAEAKKLLARAKTFEATAKAAADVGSITVPTVAKPTDTTGAVKSVTDPVRAKVLTPDLTGIQLVGVSAWATARAKHYPTKTAMQHIEEAGLQTVADSFRETKADFERNKAFLSTTVGGGDNVIFTPLSTDFIDFLRNQSVFLSAGPVELDMSYGSLAIPGGNAGAAAAYGAEGDAIGYTQATTRKVSMAAKHLRAITAISNYLIEVSPLAVASILGNDLAMSLRLGMDAAGLRGDGQSDNPAGIKSLLHADHTIDAPDENQPTYEEVDREVQRMFTLWRASNVPRIRPRWLMSSRTFTYLQFMRDGNGNLIYPGLSLDSPTWYNVPVSWSEQVPSTLGTGTDESELYLQDFGHVLMGITRAIRLASSTEASYFDGTSPTPVHRSAFANDETVIRGVASHDFDMRHTKSGVLLEKVKWGAPD